MVGMTQADDFERVRREDVSLMEGPLGYTIRVHGQYAGAIEGKPDRLEYIEIDLHWEGKGVARAALNEFIELSREHSEAEVSTNNATHPAMEHILRTEEFERPPQGAKWEKISNSRTALARQQGELRPLIEE